jgi:PRTRC genetic system protein B
MNEITRTLSQEYHPEAALIAYKNPERYSAEYYLEMRKIDEQGCMGVGHPVSYDFINGLIGCFSEQFSKTPYGVLPKEMLFADSRKGFEKYIWKNPPCQRFMYFKESLNVPNGEYWLPGLIFMVKASSLQVFAVKSPNPAPDSPLYIAPFFNVSHQGNVCLGNGKLAPPENMTFQNLIKYWEDLFFLTEFSHITGSNPTKNNLVLVVKASKERFDTSELIPCKKLKLKDLMK